MSYQINYDTAGNRSYIIHTEKKQRVNSSFSVKFVIIVVILVIAISQFCGIKYTFSSDAKEAFLSLEKDIKEGENVIEAFHDFCREVLIHAELSK